jgi:hypothetical protein
VTCPVATGTFYESCAAQDTRQYLSVASRVTTLLARKAGNSFASGATLSFSRRNMLHGVNSVTANIIQQPSNMIMHIKALMMYSAPVIGEWSVSRSDTLTPIPIC